MHPGHKCWKTSFSIVLIAIRKLVDGALGRLHDDLIHNGISHIEGGFSKSKGHLEGHLLKISS